MGDLDVPAPGEPASQGGDAGPGVGGKLSQGSCAGGPGDEGSERRCLNRGGLGGAGRCGVAGGAFGGAVLPHRAVADGASGSVGFHPRRSNRQGSDRREHKCVVLSRILGE